MAKKKEKEEIEEEAEEEPKEEVPQEEAAEEAPEEGPAEEAPKEEAPAAASGGFGERQMFSATCSECGKETEVPFKPDESRPVYCRDCYMKRRRPRGRY